LASIKNSRDATICALYREGATLCSIGALFGLTYEGVRRIAAKAGLNKRNAGLAARKLARPAPNRSEIVCQRRYGCSLEELARVIPAKRLAFLEHRKNVLRDEVPWRLTLTEWCRLWRASGKWNQRGRGPDKYGMTRTNLDGAMELGNVQIMPNREALRRARLRSFHPPLHLKVGRSARPIRQITQQTSADE